MLTDNGWSPFSELSRFGATEGASCLPGTQRLGTQERHPGCPSKVATSRYIYNFLGEVGGMMDLMTFFLGNWIS